MTDDFLRQLAALRALRDATIDPAQRAALDAAIAALGGVPPPASLAVAGHAEIAQQVSLSGGSVGQVIARQENHVYAGAADLTQRRARYLERLAAQVESLPLRALDERADRGEALALHRVYTLLAVGSLDDAPGLDQAVFEGGDRRRALKREHDPDWALPDKALYVGRVAEEPASGAPRLHRQRLAAEAFARSGRLVLLGAPGSGKSTFVRHLAWSRAAQAQGGAADTLPLILPLRALAGRVARDGPAATTLLAALRDAMAACCVQQVDDVLDAALADGTALLLFDGLDEVPIEATPASADRAATLGAVRAFLQLHKGGSALLTCRTRAFDESLRSLLGWPVETLAPFTLGQIRHFARAWYAELAARGQLTLAQAGRLAEALVAALTSPQRPRLREMAENPLLLTMMALVLANQGELPRDRPQLYQRVLALLLGQWDKVSKQGQSLFEAVGLAEWPSERILPLLDRLSYQAHRDTASEDGRGRLARGELYVALLDFFTQARVAQPGEAAHVALQYVEQRSGLLSADGPRSYAFAHLTLQEHCAGRYIALNEEPEPGSAEPPDPVALAMRHRGEDRWREPILLGAGLMRLRDLDALLGELITREGKDDARWYRDLILAAEIGADRDWSYLATTRVVKAERHQRELRAGLVALLSDRAQPLPVGERVQAGFFLGDLGDPRFPSAREAWRDEVGRLSQTFGAPAGYFCMVPGGRYGIGGWKRGEKEVTIPLAPFWIARYPITVAQYGRFVEAGGPTPYVWGRESFSDPNQPVVGVSWRMAMTYCAWLSEWLAGELPPGYALRLPTEAEWETATSFDGSGTRRPYPWGTVLPSPERAIYDASKLGRPAPVGCCPQGAAACGALDLAGNVWELQANEYRAYPAGAHVPLHDLTDGWVLWRGGSWADSETNVRCGARVRSLFEFDVVIGFRVVLAPSIAQIS